MILTDAQKRQVLLNMVYENDDKFLGLAYKMTRPARPKNDICSVPMGNSFLRNNSNSRAQFAMLNGIGKNWLNFMDDVELLHYIDYLHIEERVVLFFHHKGEVGRDVACAHVGLKCALGSEAAEPPWGDVVDGIGDEEFPGVRIDGNPLRYSYLVVCAVGDEPVGNDAAGSGVDEVIAVGVGIGGIAPLHAIHIE